MNGNTQSEIEQNETECELCGEMTEDATLTHDTHPEGVNHVVCPDCAEEVETPPMYECRNCDALYDEQVDYCDECHYATIEKRALLDYCRDTLDTAVSAGDLQ